MNRRRYLRDFICKASKALKQAYPLSSIKPASYPLADKSEFEMEGIALELADLMQEPSLVLTTLGLAGDTATLKQARAMQVLLSAFLNGRHLG
jgi:hypothetical protein